jgi:hypothetical protein
MPPQLPSLPAQVLASNGLTYAQRPEARFGSSGGGFGGGKWGQNGGSGKPDGGGDGFKFTLKP